MKRCLTLFAFFACLPASYSQQLSEQKAAALVNALPARCIGPANMGGRITDLDVVESDPKTIYIAAATGGVWKTSDAGKTWAPIFDDASTLCIGDVTIAPSNPDIVWVGTGEANPRNSVSWGDGVFKSTDAGKTWKNMGLKETQHIGRIVIHPKNPDIVYVAALGHIWGANKERGIYKTTDGGATWDLCHFLDNDTGFIDLIMDPADVGTLYACAYCCRRDGFSGGNPRTQFGDKAGIYKTADAGKTWTKLAEGLPTRPIGRCGVAVYRKDPNIVYAVVQTDRTSTITPKTPPKMPMLGSVEVGGIFRSEDKGKTWKKLNDLCPRPFYYGQIRIDPTNDKRVYVLGVQFHVSDDGGVTFTNRTGMHSDHHALWINPKDSNQLVVGNDGGLYFSHNKAQNFEAIRGMAIAQFYGVAVDMRTPYRVYGGLQDNGSWGGVSATTSTEGITLADWRRISGADGFQCAVDPDDPFTVYSETQYGGLLRNNVRGKGGSTRIKPSAGEGQPTYRFNWNSPIVLSSHDSKTIYFAGNHVFKSTNQGNRWEKISPDLTNGRPGPSQVSGHTIHALAESPKKAGLLYAGTDDGNLHVSKDDGKSWTNLTEKLPGPKERTIGRIECSAHDEGTAFVTIDRHRNDDRRPYLFKTTDHGATWKSLTANLPDGAMVNVIRQSSKNADLLFVGTENGLFASLDGGAKWHRINRSGLPGVVPVDDLVIHPRDRDLVIGTHGRAIWVMDVKPLEELDAKLLQKQAHLFSIKPALAFEAKTPDEPSRSFLGKNPPFGAVIHFHLKETMAATITINDEKGKKLRKLEGKKQAGMQSVVWDLRVEGSMALVSPGEYTATLKVGNQELTQQVKVEALK